MFTRNFNVLRDAYSDIIFLSKGYMKIMSVMQIFVIKVVNIEMKEGRYDLNITRLS